MRKSEQQFLSPSMKLHLPASLRHILALAMLSTVYAAETVTLNTLQPSPDAYYGDTYYEVKDSNILLNGNWQPEFNHDWGATIVWESTESGAEYTLSGSGSMGNLSQVTRGEYDTILDVTLEIRGNSTFTIESGVTLNTLDLEVNGGAKVVLEGTYTQEFVEFIAHENCTIDVSQARVNSTYTSYNFSPDSTICVSTVTISRRSNIFLNGYDGPYTAYMNGNLVLSAGSLGLKSEQHYHWEDDPMTYRLGSIDVYGAGTLAVSGTITISGATPVIYGVGSYQEGLDWEGARDGLDRFNNGIDFSAPLFSCSSINEGGLKLLEPYLYLDVYDSENEEYAWYKPLLDKEYYAVSGADGRVYVYLGTAGSGAIPPNAIVVGKDKEVQLGKDEDTTPSASKQVYLQTGGSADASTLDNSLLNNKLILGNGGTLKTDSLQTMSLTGSGAVNYSIVAADNSTSAAKLEIGEAGSSANLKLNGAAYDSSDVQVKGGVVTISGNTSVGVLDANTASSLEIDSGAKLTNYGEVKADVTTAGNTSILNENVMKGDVELAETAVLTNNGEIKGKLEAKGKVYGSGTFNETALAATALMHVGNSPGYQKHTSLDINRGATLSFTVDGTTPATATNHGSGTYSVLEADNITINPGTGKVNVEVEVTSGIVGAGTAPFEVTLIQAGTTNAVADDFTINIEDNGWLEEGAEVIWDAAAGTMILSGSVNEQVLAAMMDSNAGNVASTMWASANVVQELARTAENQFLVGMPGQTTFWGAAIGTFMDVGGDYGFRYNAGGYAVGVQHAFTESFRAGFAFGQTYGDFTSDDEQLKVDQKSLIPALTAQYVCKTGKMSTMTVSGHVAYGTVENTGDFYQTGNSGKAEWDDTVLNVGIRAAWNVELSEETAVSLFTGLTYQEVEQDSFTEKSAMGDRRYTGGSMSSLSLPLGITWRGVYQMDGTNVFAPEVTVAYVADLNRDDPKVNTSMFGFRGYGEGADIGRSAFMLSVGGNWMFNSSWSVGAFYTMEARSNQLNQSLNAALRYSF